MSARRVNLDYLNLYQEIPLFCALTVGSLFSRKRRQKTGNVLIVNTCLIGEFAASVPAIRDYILRNGGNAVDLMVAPPLKSLAERIRGVRRVYTARSLYGRSSDTAHHAVHTFEAYDTIFVMRISADVYRLVRTIAAGEIRTGLRSYSGYALHLWGSLLLRRRPKQWRELNFEMLGGVPRQLSFDEMFAFTPEDTASVAALDVLRTSEKKVIIHTGVSWPMKHWSTDRWVALLGRIRRSGDYHLIFVGGREDEADYAAIAAQLEFPVHSLIGRIDLPQLLLALRASDYFIGVDSGPANLARLAELRSLTLYGPGPHMYLPFDPRDIALDKSRGRGLYQMFFYTKDGFIDRITVDEVYDAFEKLVWNS